MKVAAYCRVSTDRDDQMNSLDNQTSFFNEYIQRNKDWDLVEIYSDEGVTGTSVKKRVQFNKMIQDAKSGKIDLIVTKEVSRFARNTVDTLNYTRELRRHNVGVYFINDNINTLENDGEFRLSIMASVAQEESRKTSSRVKWGMKRQMEKGFCFSPPMLGYESKDGVLTVNEEEAKIVRRIFDLYVNERMGTQLIAKKLAEENTPLTKRLKCWSPTAVMRILKNEKYVGDLIQQKTMVVDYLTHKAVENDGDKLYFRDHHEPIVSREIWNEAQRICESRKSDTVEYNPSKHTNRYWCSGKVQCGICKGACVTKTKKAQHGTIRIYRCKRTTFYENADGGCTNSSFVDERILCACMQHVLKKIALSAEEIHNQIVLALNSNDEGNGIANDIKRLEQKAESLNAKKKKMLSLLVDDVISKEDYQSSAKDIDREIYNIQNEISMLKHSQNSLAESETHLAKIFEYIKKYVSQLEPTKEIYGNVLERIVIYDDAKVDIYLTGISKCFSVKYYREGRGTQYKVYCEDI